ncbi:hypothetical protein PENTCL1PPCAC_4725 [Pristionchus entomophagus]|uniref:Uncharacterized protein n=1 Tax=Pristionchus entomophagus TaxID=358040 RepID=A0AAV5SI31_9BILA|nr:hypothetical protein PENTCL1PPCAC_4725 [Pristionchus entomophagus]
MRLAALMLFCAAVYSLEAAIVSREKRASLFDGFRFKSFKMTKRPSLPAPVEEPTPDTSFIVEKPPATMKPRLTLEEKFAMDLAQHGAVSTPSPRFSVFQSTPGGLWDFASK